MHVARVSIQNFRGISSATVRFTGTSILLGDNNSGKSTIFEALELALGPERLYRRPPINEHDFCGAVTLMKMAIRCRSLSRSPLQVLTTNSSHDSGATSNIGTKPAVRCWKHRQQIRPAMKTCVCELNFAEYTMPLRTTSKDKHPSAFH